MRRSSFVEIEIQLQENLIRSLFIYLQEKWSIQDVNVTQVDADKQLHKITKGLHRRFLFRQNKQGIRSAPNICSAIYIENPFSGFRSRIAGRETGTGYLFHRDTVLFANRGRFDASFGRRWCSNRWTAREMPADHSKSIATQKKSKLLKGQLFSWRIL